MAYSYPYPRPALTVDVVVFAEKDEQLRVLLIRRGKDPFAGHWALPGGFVDEGEDLAEAAARELVEETGLSTRLGPQLGAYGGPGRDPRGHTVSVVYLAWLIAGPCEVQGLDDATDARWHTVRRLPKLAFDHRQVLRDALTEFQRRGNVGVGELLALLPKTFEASQAYNLVATAEGGQVTPQLRARVRRGLRATERVIELDALRFRQR